MTKIYKENLLQKMHLGVYADKNASKKMELIWKNTIFMMNVFSIVSVAVFRFLTPFRSLHRHLNPCHK